MTEFSKKIYVLKTIAVSFLLLGLLSPPVFAQFGLKKDLVKIHSYSSLDKVSPGSEFKVAVKLNIEKSWHINSDKPHDEFLPNLR